MSCRSYTYLKVTVRDAGEAAKAEARRFAEAGGWTVREDGSKAELRAEVSGGWLADVLSNLEGELSGLRIDPALWSAEVAYEYDEEPHEDGASVRISIEGGKIASYRESRMVFDEKPVPDGIAFEAERPEGCVGDDARDAAAERVERLEVPCAYGTLVAEFFGQPGTYDGISVDLVRPDGSATQLCVAESVEDGHERKLHVLSWDGDSERAVYEQLVKPDGAYSFEHHR